ncbi:MAG: formate C-acetyltransferase/glycerol dehydratase family glycyl radical enzyme, partial [Dehalococcoidia bacterium]|nr:formate C-acetyltransferase/glycerol dehydratase family glycyl radical enzyme [Dehalococcoidia bacterium]
PSVSSERALLLTQFMQQEDVQHLPIPIQRAKAFQHLLAHQTITIAADELIVGERGPAAKATPTYPELCCHSLEDLDVLDTRVKTPFRVSANTRREYADAIIPFWSGQSMRESVFEAMTPSWHDAFDAGVFTEFMEQRAPGHAVLDDKIYRSGIADLKERITKSRQRIATSSAADKQAKLDELTAMDICCDAIVCFAHRHAALARELATDPQATELRRGELNQIADICMHVPEHAPRTFHEALQMYWFVHLGVICELNEWDSLNPGRLDQHLFPFYEQETAAGALNPQDAKELLACFWIKFSNQPAPPKVGVTEEQSATYNDFTLINIGGVDVNGENAVNELSYLMLDVIEDMKLPYTGSCVQLSKTTPDRFLFRTLEVIRNGFGQPSIFNTDAILQQFLRAGKSIADARAGGPSGCVTISAFGKESCVLTGYMNWAKILELALHNGVDPATGKQIGPQTGDPCTFDSFDQVIEAYSKQLTYFVDLK